MSQESIVFGCLAGALVAAVTALGAGQTHDGALLIRLAVIALCVAVLAEFTQ